MRVCAFFAPNPLRRLQYVCRALGNGQADVGYTAHPSFVTHEELGSIKGPLSIAAAGK